MAFFGAPPGAWDHFCALGLVDELLPVVSNPGATIAEESTLQSVGKTPSVYNANRCVTGLYKWAQRRSHMGHVNAWKLQPDYGICLQTRRVRAIDIDVPDQVLSNQIVASIDKALGFALPRRYRANSGKVLLAFSLDSELFKHVIPVGECIIEILASGQQFIACGMHESGHRYQWSGQTPDFGPDIIPELTREQFDTVLRTLELVYATGETRIARQRKGAGDTSHITGVDERSDWLLSNWEVYDEGPDGRIYLRCPFSEEHSSEQSAGSTSTAYFPAGTGGYEQGHWVCLHAHCQGRDDLEFDIKSRYVGGGFTAIAPPQPGLLTDRGVIPEGTEWPRLMRDKKGWIEPTALNIDALIRRPDITGMHIAFDEFTHAVVWAPYGPLWAALQWQPFSDGDYVRLRMALETRAMKAMSKDAIRGGVQYAAQENRLDSAQEWLSRLKWDGVSRVPTFMSRYFGTADTDYTRAVSAYLWTALAGRAMSPGCQVDMVPTLLGAQGKRKTSAVLAMVPSPEFYVEVNLKSRDDDLSRRMRGKLIGELEELRGVNSREAEDIKAWITRREDSWVPKFMEFETRNRRRTVLIGTGNNSKYLNDSTGERRWLPVEIISTLSVDDLKRDRDQLWAEALVRWQVDGIAWQDAEALADREHLRFKVDDEWLRPVREWLESAGLNGVRRCDRPFTSGEMLVGAIGLSLAGITAVHKSHAERTLTRLGYDLHFDPVAGENLWTK